VPRLRSEGSISQTSSPHHCFIRWRSIHLVLRYFPVPFSTTFTLRHTYNKKIYCERTVWAQHQVNNIRTSRLNMDAEDISIRYTCLATTVSRPNSLIFPSASFSMSKLGQVPNAFVEVSYHPASVIIHGVICCMGISGAWSPDHSLCVVLRGPWEVEGVIGSVSMG
jgi:hypothetical protein